MKLYSALVILCLLAGGIAYPFGAPESACKIMKPGHGERIRRTQNHIKSCVLDGDKITVTLNGTPYKGIQVQIRDGVEPTKAIGKFHESDIDITKYKVICDGNAVTHIDSDSKESGTFTATVKAADIGKRPPYCVVAFVESYASWFGEAVTATRK